MIAQAQGTGSTGAEGQEVSGQLFFLFAFQTSVISLYTSLPQQQFDRVYKSIMAKSVGVNILTPMNCQF